MDHEIISGYVCPEERMIRRYVVPTCGAFMLLVGCFLLIEALRHQVSISHWLCAICWFIYLVFLFVLFHRIRVADKLEFCIWQSKIINAWPGNCKIELDLSESYFCTLLTTEFSYAKAKTERVFYLFSSKPIDSRNIKGGGLFLIESINKNNIIIIPKNAATDIWEKEILRLNNISVYPAIAFKQGDKGTVLLSPDTDGSSS